MAANICGGHPISPSSDQVKHSPLSQFLVSYCQITLVPYFRDFFTWLFQPGKEQLEVLAAIAIPTIQGLVSLSRPSI